ncbi:MAG TPA: hypothetical protein VJC17_01530 [Candidatus Dojkabacteria bacterium]|nr:hypothetical protein [Candidatus Dojkabacteria bacterium]
MESYSASHAEFEIGEMFYEVFESTLEVAAGAVISTIGALKDLVKFVLPFF